MITTKLHGWEELKKALSELPNKIERNVIRGAMDRAARLVAEKAKETTLFQDRTGTLRKSIKVKRKKPKMYEVGADVVAEAPHAHLIEFGWMQKTKEGSRQIPARPFFRNALEDNREEVLAHIEKQIRELLQKQLTKLGMR